MGCKSMTKECELVKPSSGEPCVGHHLLELFEGISEAKFLWTGFLKKSVTASCLREYDKRD